MLKLIDIERLTDIGVYRERNEDSYIYFRCKLDGQDITIACVCDGMGGLDAGDYASKELCESLKRGIFSKDFVDINELKREVTSSIKEANRIIFSNKTQYGKQCGTTVTCVVLADKGYAWHVGDSRLMMISNSNVRALTKDHTYVRRLVDKGKITKEEARNHPKRSALTNAIGVFKDVSIDMFEFDYRNTTLVLATDGFWNGLTDSDYLSISSRDVTLEDMMNRVIKRGETDNITALALYC